MIRDWLRRMLGYTNKIERNNKWVNMKSVNTVNYVEEITEEEKEAQKESEKLRLERLKLKFDPSYVPDPSVASLIKSNSTSKQSKESTPDCPDNDVTQGVKYTFFDNSSSEMVNPADPVLEPDPSVFQNVDLRTNKSVQPKISAQLHNDIVTVLTGASNVITNYNINITRIDLNGLTGENWVNDNIIEVYMQMVAERSNTKTWRNLGRPRLYCMSTYFFISLIKRGHGAMQRWTKDVDIFSYDIILIPIHQEDHWCLATVDFRSPGVFYYDSMASHNMPALSAILGYLQSEHLSKKGSELNVTNFAKEIVDCPQQENGADCGIFACKFAEFISREAPVNFTQEDMPYYRKRMIWEIAKKQLLTP